MSTSRTGGTTGGGEALADLPAPGPDDPRPYRPCVGIVLTNADGLVFVGQRIDMPGAWQMPQGGIDPGETPVEAAWRELAEETGVTAAKLLAETRNWLCYDLPRTPPLDRAWRGRYRGQAQKWFLMRLLGRDTDIDLGVHKPEFDVWAWQAPSQITAGIIAFKRPVYSAVFEAFTGLVANR